jgi:hypothetical protein
VTPQWGPRRDWEPRRNGWPSGRTSYTGNSSALPEVHEDVELLMVREGFPSCGRISEISDHKQTCLWVRWHPTGLIFIAFCVFDWTTSARGKWNRPLLRHSVDSVLPRMVRPANRVSTKKRRTCYHSPKRLSRLHQILWSNQRIGCYHYTRTGYIVYGPVARIFSETP